MIMTKEEAQRLMQQGHKITHRYFEPHEYIYEKHGKLYDEKGYALDKRAFWVYRGEQYFDTGWDIYQPNNKQ